ncbi:hypothetical protein [Lacipirellula parvula]|uniref:Trimeric autotransporter adhesin YadA-like head domain-containing protein n=1 Tax=Lacipirellula parvula TaxID=2650471 RepID=A0A5K7XC83_9BACT|nr:hypothetical protein [Lacipirellula parvula]BBO34430.1 hypothetical protein PLANPX_4042 [Lacipirellula parvula]
MASWMTYKGLEVPDTPVGDAGVNLKDDLTVLADRAPYNAAANPTVNDDSGDGFVAGSQWFNTSTQTLWVCTNSGLGAARWRSLYRRIDNAIVLAPDAGVGSGSDSRALQLDDSGNARGANAVDLQRVRSVATQVAFGANSGIFAGHNNVAISDSGVVGGGKNNNAGGGVGAISNIAVGSPAVTITSTNHGLITGQQIQIAGSNSTPAVNGNRFVTVTGSNTFTIPAAVAIAGNAGSWSTSATAAYAFVSGGESNQALGKWSHAQGRSTISLGNGAHTEGVSTTATGGYSHAEGSNSTAIGSGSHAEGWFSTASGNYSHAEGAFTSAGLYAHSEGYGTYAFWTAHAEGQGCAAQGVPSHAEGFVTQASGAYSHSEGVWSTASGEASHAGGRNSSARLTAQWARGSGGHDDALGTAQATISTLWGRTTNATATELLLGSTIALSRFTLADGQTLSCFINVVGRKENGAANDHASFLRQACIRREGATTSLVGAVQTVGADINPAGWGGIAVTADDTNESLKIAVTGAASTNIRWTATVFASEAADAAV